MSDQPTTAGRTADPDPPPDPHSPSNGGLRRLVWLLPALTFVVGVVLGAVVVGAITSGADSAGAVAGGPAPSATGGTSGATGATPTTGPTPGTGDVTVTVPAECAALADDARNAAGLLDEAATAARDLDARALAGLVRRMQDARTRLASQADACRGAAASATTSSG